MAAPVRRVSFVTVLLALVLIAVTVGMAYRGWSYYLLSAEARTEHPDFRTLRATGFIGNGYGWVAALLIVMNLSYLLRRRFGGFGHMRVWLDIHVFTGMVAASLVSFHSAFQLRAPVTTAATAALAIVVMTGLIGRFLYALAPAGHRERLKDALDAVEHEFPGKRDPLAKALGDHPGPNVPANASLVRCLFAIPSWRSATRARLDIVDALVPGKVTRGQRAAIKELRIAAAADARASGVTALLRSWRGLHRFFALLMLAAVLLHAGVAWYFGYRWIFS